MYFKSLNEWVRHCLGVWLSYIRNTIYKEVLCMIGVQEHVVNVYNGTTDVYIPVTFTKWHVSRENRP